MTLSTIANAVNPFVQNGHLGPMLVGTDLYFICEDAGTADKVGCFKSTDGGSNWTRQDTGNAPIIANNLYSLASVLDGTTIHIIGADERRAVGKTFAQIFEYYTFNTSTDLWDIDEQITDTDLNTTADHEVGIAVRSDGDVIVTHQISDRTDMGNDYLQYGYSRREGGSWTTEVPFNAANELQQGADLVMAPNDECHMCHVVNTSPSNFIGYVQTLDSGNSLSTRVSAFTADTPADPTRFRRPVTFDISGTQKVLYANRSGRVRRLEEDGSGDMALESGQGEVSPFTTGGTSAGGVAYDTVDADGHFMGISTDADLFRSESPLADDASWTTEVEQEDNTNIAHTWIEYYARDGGRQIGYVVEDVSTMKFGELVLSAGGAKTETVTDDVDVTDSTTREAPAVREQSDDADVTDSTTKVGSVVRAQSDSVGVTDSATPVLTIAVEVTEAIGVIDSTSVKQNKAIAEGVGVTDSTTRIAPAIRSVVEGIAVADAISDSETNRETLVETLGVIDSTPRITVTRRSIPPDVGLVVAAETWGTGTGTDWTIAQGGDFDWLVSSERGTTDLNIVSGEGRVEGLFSSTTIAAATITGETADDLEVLLEVTVSGQENSTGIAVVLRHSATNTYYSLGIARDSGVSLWVGATSQPQVKAIVKNDGGTRTVLAEEISNFLVDGDWWIRARIVGDKLKLKVWQGAEPDAWDLEATDGGLTGAQKFGFHYAGKDTTTFTLSEFTASEAFGVVGVTDDATPVKTIQVAITEAIGVTDSTARIHTAARTPADDVGVTDLITPVKTITVEITEVVGVTDATPFVLQISVEISESLGVTDLTTRIAPAIRAIAEAMAVSDVISDSETNRETSTEPVGVTDLIARLAPAIRSLVEAMGVTDVIAPVKTITIEITETLGVTDSTPHVLTIVRSIAEAVGVTDVVVDDLTVGGGDLTETVTDPVGVTDTSTRIQIVIRSVVEAVGVTDSTAPAKSITVAITEAVGVTDSTTPAKTITVTISEALGVIDSTTRVHDAVRSVVEAIGVTDAIASAKSITVSIAEAVGVTDDTPFTLQIAVAISDDVGVTDSTTRVAPAVRPIVETVAVQDAISDTETNRETLTEPVGITDLIARVHAAFRTITDDADVTDLVTAIKTIQIEISEALGLTDLISPAKTATAGITEPIGVTDSTTPAKAIQVSISESVGVTDNAVDALSGATLRSVVDPIGITDSTARTWTIVRSITESVGVTDLAIKGEVNEEVVVEALGVTDVASPAKASVRSVTEVAGVTDNIEVVLSIAREISESTGVVDDTSRVAVAARALVENVGVTTVLDRTADWIRILADNVNVTEIVLAIDQAPSSLVPLGTVLSDEPVTDVVSNVPADVRGDEF